LREQDTESAENAANAANAEVCFVSSSSSMVATRACDWFMAAVAAAAASQCQLAEMLSVSVKG